MGGADSRRGGTEVQAGVTVHEAGQAVHLAVRHSSWSALPQDHDTGNTSNT